MIRYRRGREDLRFSLCYPICGKGRSAAAKQRSIARALTMWLDPQLFHPVQMHPITGADLNSTYGVDTVASPVVGHVEPDQYGVSYGIVASIPHAYELLLTHIVLKRASLIMELLTT